MKDADFMVRAKKAGAIFGAWLANHWLTVSVLLVSATQTFALFFSLAPQYIWLAPLAVCVLEGGFLYWRWREYTADLADGSLADVEKNAQEKIANRMVYVTLLLSVLTMLAGAVVELAESDLVAVMAVPSNANVLGLIAIGGVFVICGLHLYYDWQYRRASPLAAIERDYRQLKRSVEADGRKKVLQARNRHLTETFDKNADGMGKAMASRDFGHAYASEMKAINPSTGDEE